MERARARRSLGLFAWLGAACFLAGAGGAVEQSSSPASALRAGDVSAEPVQQHWPPQAGSGGFGGFGGFGGHGGTGGTGGFAGVGGIAGLGGVGVSPSSSQPNAR
ncbi:MAG TPA: hypothetical protein VHM19_11070 [Polyangiales bacterium]|jgi:hypothetical protein|nr:hypothetical protein [Polyangiales bacterium]